MHKVFVGFFLFFSLTLHAQSHKKKPKVSFSKGTFYGYYGYNRSAYTKSTIHFTGPGYEYSLAGCKASDDPRIFDPGVQFNPLKATSGQYNVRFGYYIKNHYSVSFGYDKLKYVFSDQNRVLLKGTINPGVDQSTNWSGDHNNKVVITDKNTFEYINSGMTYIRLEGSRTDHWLAVGRDQKVVLSSNVGIGIGGIISENTFRFAGDYDQKTASFSGYAVSVHAGARVEFFKHLFIQSNLSGGFVGQTHVATRADEPNSFASQKFGYLQFDTNIGVLLYIRPTNSCNSCPVW